MEARAAGETRFSIYLQMGPEADPAAFLRASDFRRYIFHPAGEDPIEFVDANSGAALLPRFGFCEYLLPRGDAESDGGFPDSLECWGLPFHRDSGEWPLVEAPAPEEVRRLRLDPEVLVGTARSIRDDGTGMHPIDPSDGGSSPRDYRYVPLAPDEYAKMIEAGMNLFRVFSEDLPHVIDESVFFVMHEGLEQHPDLLYRSNYLGAVMYMDEPAARAFAKRMFEEFDDPREAATTLLELTRGRFVGDGGYGSGFLEKKLKGAGWNVPHRGTFVADFPVWEGIAGAAWYELEAGPGGWCHQARYQPDRFRDTVRSGLGIDFPASTEACVLFHYAQFRGAARHFGARWGVGIYGQMAPEAARVAFPLAYDRGATWFLLWTSDRGHHVPWEQQLEYVRDLREYMERNPRGGRAVDHLRGARAAISVPWGYALDRFAIGASGRVREGRIWRSERLELDANNRARTPHRTVLAAAMTEAVRLLEGGEEFDILFLKPGERAVGYDRLLRVMIDGSVRAE